MSNKNIALALLAGAAAGTLLGILIAPASGADTRKKIVKGAVSAKDTIGYRLLQVEETLAKMRTKQDRQEAQVAETHG